MYVFDYLRFTFITQDLLSDLRSYGNKTLEKREVCSRNKVH